MGATPFGRPRALCLTNPLDGEAPMKPAAKILLAATSALLINVDALAAAYTFATTTARRRAKPHRLARTTASGVIDNRSSTTLWE